MTSSTGNPGARPRTIGQDVRVRNVPLQPAEWEALLDRDETTAVETDSGEMALTMEDGQLRLYYAFASVEDQKAAFGPMWRVLSAELADYDAPYVAVHLVELPNRRWVDPLLAEAAFESSGEWMELEHHELSTLAPPEFPPQLTMRRGDADDFDRIIAIAEGSYGEHGDGVSAIRARCEAASWVGVLEQDGGIVAYALNGEIERRTGSVLSAAVASEAWGRGLGRLILHAAAYQLASRDAATAVVRALPQVPRSVETAIATGFRARRHGIEYRRPTDDAEIERRLHERQVRGMKARFGGWR